MTAEDIEIRLRPMSDAVWELQLNHLPELRALERTIEAQIRAGKR